MIWENLFNCKQKKWNKIKISDLLPLSVLTFSLFWFSIRDIGVKLSQSLISDDALWIFRALFGLELERSENSDKSRRHGSRAG